MNDPRKNKNNSWLWLFVAITVGAAGGCATSTPRTQVAAEAPAAQSRQPQETPTETLWSALEPASAPAQELQLPDYWNVFLSFPDAEHHTLASDDVDDSKDAADGGALVLETARRSAPDSLLPFQRGSDSERARPEDQALVLSTPDLWTRIRSGFRLQEIASHDRTVAEINWYARHQGYIDRTVERARPYLYLIIDEIKKRDIPTEIALLPVVESAFQPFAYSHGRAAGIWQFIPSTGKLYGLKQNWWYDGRRDILASTRAALDHLNDLHRYFDDDWLLALAAYNSGQGTVNRAIRHNRRRGRPTDFWSLNLPHETRGYVPKLLAISAIVAEPARYHISLKSIPDRPVLSKVEIGSQIDLALAAELAGISLQEVYRYNPAFNRWATDPDGPHYLLLPINKVESFRTQLAALPRHKRVHWARHRIRGGETLSEIAERYHTTVSLLKKINRIRGTTIRMGDNLIIPVAARKIDNYTLSASQRLRAIQNQPNGSNRIKYTVRRGDTLWDIARDYGVRVASLARWNGMAPRDMLRPGQHLVIWQKKSRSSNTTTLASNLGVMPPSSLQKIRYIVRHGDSLSRISQKFRVKISQLRKWNALPRDKYLQPGQVLTLFVDITRQSDSL